MDYVAEATGFGVALEEVTASAPEQPTPSDDATHTVNGREELQNVDPEPTDPTVGFTAEKWQQLVTELGILKQEQDKFRHEQAEWSTILSERDCSRNEVLELRALVMKTEEQSNEKLSKLKNEYEARLAKVQKDRDSMVVKYAHSEKEVLVAQNQRESAEKKMKDLAKERDVLLEKIKALNNEKSRICNMLEVKSNEYFSSQRDLDRMKDEVNAREVKVRTAQSKLKSETESHQETQSKYEKSVQQIKQLKEELEEWKRSCNELKSKENEGRAVNEAQVLEEKARWIVEKQNFEEQIIGFKNTLKEFESMKVRHTQLVEENAELQSKVQKMQKDHVEMEQQVAHLKEQTSLQRQTIIQSQTQLAEMDGVQEQLERERERLSKNQHELASVRQCNADLEEEMQKCRAKERELLEFTQKLTEANVRLQSDFTAYRETAEKLEGERGSILEKLETEQRRTKSLLLELQDEKDNRSVEASSWKQTISEKSRLCEDLQTQVREVQNELNSVRRKHAINIKELTRELRVTKKRLDQLESPSAGANGGNNSHEIVSLGSRTSSNTSLNTEHQTPEHSPSPTQAPVMSPDWERTALLEKMVRIQRDNAKKSEKIDFLEEHVSDLTAEVKKKNKILQLYLISQDSGSMASEASDRHKAEIAKHGGIMSSMYNMKTLDDGLNLELCLEINQKLQNVLEDTLLKNMTLKDNLSTLGAEVARITQQYQALLQSK